MFTFDTIMFISEFIWSLSNLIVFSLFFTFSPHLRIWLEREEGRQREVRNTHWLPPIHTLNRIKPRTQAYALTGIKPATRWCTRGCCNQLSHQARMG